MMHIRPVAKVIGLLISSVPAVEYGPLFYRSLEIEKVDALKHCGNYDTFMKITPEMKEDLSWWIENLPRQNRDITKGNAEMSISSDASNKGWGGICGKLKRNVDTYRS